MYWENKWIFAGSNEYEYKFVGRFGKKGEPRQKRMKPTPEQMKKQNQRNRENKVRRLMKANFGENDYWVTLKFPAGTRMAVSEVKDCMKGFLRRARGAFRKQGYELKYIYRIEIGKRGSPHVHILVNRIPDGDVVIKKCWRQGRVDFTLAYEAGGFQRLAEYLVKVPNERNDPEGETKAYTPSRNLTIPQPERKRFKRRTMERMIRDGIKPTEGFYIDRDSIHYGVNPYTGMTYLKYIEYRIPAGRGKHAEDQSLHSHRCKVPGKAEGEIPLHPGTEDGQGPGDADGVRVPGGDKEPHRGGGAQKGAGKSK